MPLWQVEVRGTFFVADDRLLCDVCSRWELARADSKTQEGQIQNKQHDCLERS